MFSLSYDIPLNFISIFERKKLNSEIKKDVSHREWVLANHICGNIVCARIWIFVNFHNKVSIRRFDNFSIVIFTNFKYDFFFLAYLINTGRRRLRYLINELVVVTLRKKFSANRSVSEFIRYLLNQILQKEFTRFFFGFSRI